MGRVVHFEIPVEDVDRAERFFSKTFGWKLDRQKGPWGEYLTVITGEPSHDGINGAFYLKKTVPPENARVINVLDIEDIDAHIDKIKEAGGKIVFGKVIVKGVGYLAYFRDPNGNILGMMERDDTAGMEEK